MKLYEQILTNNDCYKACRKINIQGIMWHSTGANNPNLSRYVQPDNGYIGKNTNGNHWNQPTPDGRQVCVHAFIGKDNNGNVATVQTLPWDHRGWHCGGAANNTHIGFEICEGDLYDAEYFKLVYKEACELTAMLCSKYNLHPTELGVVICHNEGYKLGVASNHADVMHWFKIHGKTMDDVRSDVLMLMHAGTPIIGAAEATVEQMQSYIKRVNIDVPDSVIDMLPLYISEGIIEGVRGDIAFAQSCLETGNFTFKGSAVKLEQNNFCGMGVTSNGLSGCSFATPQLGIRAQIQHLKAYATTDSLVNSCIDERYKFVQKGCAKYVEWLGQQENPNGKGWAAGANYGSKILNILSSILSEQCWYRVQCGAFKTKELAAKRVVELIRLGYDAFIQ